MCPNRATDAGAWVAGLAGAKHAHADTTYNRQLVRGSDANHST